jgi:hypothetical protein
MTETPSQQDTSERNVILVNLDPAAFNVLKSSPNSPTRSRAVDGANSKLSTGTPPALALLPRGYGKNL